jgi:protein HIRA/HIR1
MESIIDQTVEESSRPRRIAKLTQHHSAVSAVRFSPKRNVLATASLDKAVYLYSLDAAGPSFGTHNEEPWNVRGYIRSQANGTLVELGACRGFRFSNIEVMANLDILDLAFSPDGNMIAVVDISGSLFVWDVTQIESARLVHQNLKAHDGSAKGVAWDPLNRYVATQVLLPPFPRPRRSCL